MTKAEKYARDAFYHYMVMTFAMVLAAALFVYQEKASAFWCSIVLMIVFRFAALLYWEDFITLRWIRNQTKS